MLPARLGVEDTDCPIGPLVSLVLSDLTGIVTSVDGLGGREVCPMISWTAARSPSHVVFC